MPSATVEQEKQPVNNSAVMEISVARADLLRELTATQSVQMLVSNSSATGSLREGPAGGLFATRTVALAMLPFAAVLLIGLRRRRVVLLLVALVSLGGMAMLSGCGTSPTSLEQSAGTYPFTVTVNSGATTLQTISFTLLIP